MYAGYVCGFFMGSVVCGLSWIDQVDAVFGWDLFLGSGKWERMRMSMKRERERI
jgi:hypothetical protein